MNACTLESEPPLELHRRLALTDARAQELPRLREFDEIDHEDEETDEDGGRDDDDDEDYGEDDDA